MTAQLDTPTKVLPHYSYAYQPIVDVSTGTVHAYEALIRGLSNESAWSVLSQVPPAMKHHFDEVSRVRAIDLAAQLGMTSRLNLNLLPQSLFGDSDPIASTLVAAERANFPANALTLEVTEDEVIADYANLAKKLNAYRPSGLLFAIDDFGAGYSGLNLLADFQPDQVKIDMNLVRGVESEGPRQAIVRAIHQACVDLGIDVVAEGVETVAEYQWLYTQGIRLFQGYLFAQPAFEKLSIVEF